MGLFSIDATDFEWIDGSKDYSEDLCLHGHAIVCIGKCKIEYDATISATALYLLKTLTENHLINTDNQMLPCCGHFMIPNETLDNVTLLGCPNGIDWSVIHDGNSVILELEDGTREYVSIAAYEREVFRFADKIETFYKSCTPKKVPADEFECNGYIAFWNEWHKRRNKSISIDKITMKKKFQRLIEQKISEWQEDDIYAVSLYVFDEEDNPCRPVAVLGYNTERQVQKSSPEASDEQEARWNYAFWIQNAEMCLGQGDTAEDIKEWITEQGLWDSEDEITPKFVEFLVAIVQDIHASGLLKDKFGEEVPILIHELEYYEKIAQQNITANGEALDRDFVSFCMPCIPEVHDEVRPSQNEVSRTEKSTAAPQPQGFHNGSDIGKQSADKRKAAVFMIAIILIMSLFWVLGLTISNHNKAASNGMQQTVSESTAETEKDSFILRYEGFDTGIEIFFKDCVCEYDKDGSCVYTYYVDDSAVEAEGYAIYIQTPENTMEIFPVADYLADWNAGCIYMIWGIQTFERIQGVEFVNGMSSYKILDAYNMEELIAEAYGLELLNYDEDFDFIQAELTGLYEKDGKIVLRGRGSALYNASYNGLGKIYSIEWEIDTETTHESAKAYLSDFDIHPLYTAFLLNQISVENPFVPESYDSNTKLTYFDDRVEYDDHFGKSFSLVDVNNDGSQELVFKMYNSPSEVVYILGVQDEKLTCYDILVTHTTHMAFWVYDNGIVEWGQNYDGDEVRYYTFTEDGKERELIHFIRESDSDSDLYYNYYYLEGNEESRFSLQSNEEYESLVSSYKGEEPEWFDCESFADIPQNQEITEAEIVEKNAKNTGEIRISTSIRIPSTCSSTSTRCIQDFPGRRQTAAQKQRVGAVDPDANGENIV